MNVGKMEIRIFTHCLLLVVMQNGVATTENSTKEHQKAVNGTPSDLELHPTYGKHWLQISC